MKETDTTQKLSNGTYSTGAGSRITVQGTDVTIQLAPGDIKCEKCIPIIEDMHLRFMCNRGGCNYETPLNKTGTWSGVFGWIQ